MSQWHGGKGSKRRPENQKAFSDNWDNIFGKKKKEGSKDEKENSNNTVPQSTDRPQ